ncbi:MAG: hydrogenase formation protein HypD [Anaerolineales bacterium]
MKYIDEYRDPTKAQQLVAQIKCLAHGRRVRLMEFCGGHTHAIGRYGLGRLLAPEVELLSGPGCPVCVTSASDLDYAIALAGLPDVLLATFGDMLRVPGSRGRTLQHARGEGADVRLIYSPLDALALAEAHPERRVVLLGVGFETTAPGMAATLLQAEAQGVPNLALLSLHKLTPPAMRAILGSGEIQLDGVIGPGHVSTVTGSEAWRFVPDEFGVGVAVSGFEPLDMLQAIYALVQMAVSGEPRVENSYARGVQPEGNRAAQALLARCFVVDEGEWRGLGRLPASGLRLAEALRQRDARALYDLAVAPAAEPAGCRCGDVLRGALRPEACPLFGTACTPRNPVGPCMVSAEGSCAAHYRYAEVAER